MNNTVPLGIATNRTKMDISVISYHGQSLCKWAYSPFTVIGPTTRSLNFTGQFMHDSTHMLSQVMLCFNWLWVIFLLLTANLWPRSPPTGQIFCENYNLTTGFSHMRVSPLLSGPRFAMLPTGYYSERVIAFLSFPVSLLYPHVHLHFVFLTLCLSVLPSVRVCVWVYVCTGGPAPFLVLIYLLLLCPLSPELDL